MLQPEQRLHLQHQLTPAQLACYDQMMTCAEELLGLDAGRHAQVGQLEATLDRACLRFYVALLDHDLRGSLFESVVVGFLAVLGIDPHKDVFKEAYHYTPALSGLTKTSQLVVLQ